MYNSKKIFKRTKVLVGILVTTLMITSSSFMAFAAEDEVYTVDQQLSFMKDLMVYINENYAGEITEEEMLNGAFDGIFETLDPYSEYYHTQEAATSFAEAAGGEFFGIGVKLDSYDGKCRVVSPIDGTPAKQAGILSGDYIISVDGLSTADMTINEVSQKLKGTEGTSVKVGVDRNGTKLSFDIIRAKISIASLSYEMKAGKIAYLKITNFYTETADDFAELWPQIKKENPKGIIVDLRDNPGGLVNVAIDLADDFLPKGAEIMHYSKQGEVRISYSAETDKIVDVPVVLLVNEGSASASEIFSAALQDNHAATLVGTQTYGKGCAQTLINLRNGGGLKLTIFDFLSPKKNVINGVGITPDYVVDTLTQEAYQAAQEEVIGFVPMAEAVKPGFGQSGLNVYGAQQRLALLGYDKVELTGIIDANTFEAIKGFQKSEGLGAYGVLDYTTKQKLNQAVIDYMAELKTGEDLQLNKAIELLK